MPKTRYHAMEDYDSETPVENGDVVQPKSTNKCITIFITCLLTTLLFVVLYAVSITFYTYKTRYNIDNPSVNNLNVEVNPHSIIGDKTVCQIIGDNSNTLMYPSPQKFTYAINFNSSIMQPNYVYYISTIGGNSCQGCNWRKDSISIFRQGEFSKSSYDTGHLVPNSDYGYDTFLMSNAIPMNSSFNRGAWKKSEEHIRRHYAGKLVYKGCDYSDKYFVSSFGNKIFIPTGCYYIVFDTSALTDISKYTIANILEYGYYQNKAKTVKEFTLPDWIKCD